MCLVVRCDFLWYMIILFSEMGSSSLRNLSYLLQMLELFIIIIKKGSILHIWQLYMTLLWFKGTLVVFIYSFLRETDSRKQLTFLLWPISNFLKETHFWEQTFCPLNISLICASCNADFSFHQREKQTLDIWNFLFLWKRKVKISNFPTNWQNCWNCF